MSSKDKKKFVVAVKDVTKPGEIRQGKILGSYRQLEFAKRDHGSLARSEGLEYWRTGIFQNGKLV